MVVVHAMLGNAAVAAVLALVAAAVGYTCRSPSARHAVWVVVLLKLVTPPLVAVSLPVLPAAWLEPPPEPTAPCCAVSAPPGTAPIPPTAGDRRSTSGGWDWVPLGGVADWALALWVAGGIGWFAWQGRRIVRFRRRVRVAENAPPEVVAAVHRLAAELGIARPPRVAVATGIGSPMLWGWGRGAVVLFPRELLGRLPAEGRDTLLAHELAHFLRRDHWVRILEFVATGLYWWHPAVWAARAGIEAAEEECCDAWVVGGLSASPRRYAEALLATVDFEAELRRPRLPPGACAASRSARLLHRRLVGIINARRPRRLRGRVVIWAAVVAVLLIRPVLRAATPDAPTTTQTDSAPANPARRPLTHPHHSPTRASAEPRAWAAAEAPGGGLTVLARDHEVVLRRPDGTTRSLGPGRPLAMAFEPGGRRLATAGPEYLVRTWDEHGGLLAETRVPAAARAVAYTPDGARLLALDATGRVSVLDPRTLAAVAGWSVEAANSITCSPDGRTVAVAFGSWLGEDGWVEVWSIAERRRVARYSAPAPVAATRFSPNGETLVAGCWNGLTTWLSLPGNTHLAERQLPKHLAATTAFCPDAGTLPLEPPPEVQVPPLTVPEWTPETGLSPDP